MMCSLFRLESGLQFLAKAAIQQSIGQGHTEHPSHRIAKRDRDQVAGPQLREGDLWGTKQGVQEPVSIEGAWSAGVSVSLESSVRFYV